MCRDRLTKIEEVASLIPDVIATEQSHTGLLWGEKLKIAEELLDKCVIIVKNEHKMWEPEYHTKCIFNTDVKNEQFMPRPITCENSSTRKCCPELIEEV